MLALNRGEKNSRTKSGKLVLGSLAERRPRPFWRRKDKVLVVDDDRDIVRLLEFNLHYDGFDVRSAVGVNQALKMLSTWKPGVVLLDLSMPELDGFELLRCLRSEPGLSNIVPIVVSARNLMGEVERALDLGAKDYILKPFDPAEVGQKVWDILHR